MATRGGGFNVWEGAHGKPNWITSFIFLCAIHVGVIGFYLETDRSFARFPKWHACVNASISFEFKTTEQDGLLMYVDDSGRYDFFEVVHRDGLVQLVLNIVDGVEGHRKVVAGHDVNDGGWHKVTIKRNRMQTTLAVDYEERTVTSFGTDFYFGTLGNTSDVFFGGLPQTNDRKGIHGYSLPSALFLPRFKGYIRNVIYGNCSCERTRGEMIGGTGIVNSPKEVCQRKDPCPPGCLCLSDDNEAKCDCSEVQCHQGLVLHYELPMNEFDGQTMLNPSGLDAKAMGLKQIIYGIDGSGLQLDGRDSFIKVAGPGQRDECLGDLDKCNMGYTIGFWINFKEPCTQETVYLSNGGHTTESHGVAMLYQNGHIEFRFRKKNGREWRARGDNILPGRWYHITATWSDDEGLHIYADGDLVGRTKTSIPTTRASRRSTFDEFYLGRANDNRVVTEKCVIQVDEFNFWSAYKNEKEIMEIGPMNCQEFTMENQATLISHLGQARLYGNPKFVDGKMGFGLQLDGSRKQYIDLGVVADTCLGDLAKCVYGVTVAMWLKFDDLKDNSYIISSGSKGFNVFYKDGKLTANAMEGNKYLETSWDSINVGKWYFLEMSWSPEENNGLRLFVNQEEVASDTLYSAIDKPDDGNNRLTIGRSADGTGEYSSMLVDDLQICYGDRKRLVDFHFLQRGRPRKHLFDMGYIVGDEISRIGFPNKLHGNPSLVQGKIGKALHLNGFRQYADFGSQNKTCLGDLDKCPHGLLIATWIKPGQLKDKMQLWSTGLNGIRTWFDMGKLYAEMQTTTRKWTVSSDVLKPDRWQFVEFSWHPENGLKLYVNNNLVSESANNVARHTSGANGPAVGPTEFFIGRGPSSRSVYANMSLDEMEYWYGTREYLIAHNYLQRGQPPHFIFDMDTIENGKLLHETLDIPAINDPVTAPGKMQNAVRFNGINQYLDLGKHQNECFGDLSKCKHGVMGSMWANFRDFSNNMYYFTNGKGVRIFYRNGRLYFVLEVAGKEWEMAFPNIQPNKWYFIEYSWHPEKGLSIYIDNKLVGWKTAPESIPVKGVPEDTHAYVGRANSVDTTDGNFRYANALIDQMETWYSDRDTLLAFDYIIRDNVSHLHIPLEIQDGDMVLHPLLDILLRGGATLVPGRVGKAVNLNGQQQFVLFGDQREECMGNLDLCNHGMTITFFVNPNRLIENSYFLSSAPYSVYYKDGKMHFKFSTSTKTWMLSTDKINEDTWQKYDVSWDETKGLQIYRDGKLIESTTEYETHESLVKNDHNVYLGRGTNDVTNYRYADATFDELEIWYANRDHLKAFDLIDEEVNHFIINMDGISGDVLIHPNQPMYTYGKPSLIPSPDFLALHFDGSNQFVDAGSDLTSCQYRLDVCKRGFTTRFVARTEEIIDDAYIVSNPAYDIFYKGDKMVAEFRTPTKKWTVSTDKIKLGSWQTYDLSWDPSDGLSMYLDGVLIDKQREPRAYTGNYPSATQSALYIGRRNEDSGKNPKVDIDSIELWEARKDLLIGKGLLRPDLEYIVFDMNNISNNKLTTSGYTVETINTPVIKTDWWGQGIQLDHKQKQYIDFGERFAFADYLDSFPNGFTMRFRINPKDLKDNTYFVSGPPYDIYFKNGKLIVELRNQTKKWMLSTDNFKPGEFQDVDISWDPNRDAVLYVNGQLEDTAKGLTNNEPYSGTDATFIGRYKKDDPYKKYADMVIDSAEFYKANREWLIEYGYLPKDIKRVVFDMEEIDKRRGRLVHPSVVAYIHGYPDEVPGVQGNGIQIKEVDTYLDINNKVICDGELVNCNKGMTMKFHIKPEELKEDTYFISSLPVDVYYDGGKLVTVFKTRDKKWELETDRFKSGDWQTVELTWDETDGATLYIDGDEVDHQTVSEPNLIPYDRASHFYLGKSNDQYRGRNQPKFTIDDLELYEAKRSLLLSLGSFDPVKPLEPSTTQGPDISKPTMLPGFFPTLSPENRAMLMFDGQSWIEYDFSKLPIDYKRRNIEEQLKVRFKTKQDDGLLWYSGEDDKNMHLTLSRGDLVLYVDYDQGRIRDRFRIKPASDTFADDEWHEAIITRRDRRLEITVDDQEFDYTMSSDIDMINDGMVYLGGSDDPSSLTAEQTDRAFKGHIREAIMQGNTLPDKLDLLAMYLSSPRPGYVKKSGNIRVEQIPEDEQGVSFETEDSYIWLPKLDFEKDGKISFSFKTIHPDGLMLYNGGRSLTQDFVALEMFDGILYFVIDLGDKVNRFLVSEDKVNDGVPHTVEIERNGKSLSLALDGLRNKEIIDSVESSLDLGTFLFIGGYESKDTLNWHLWTRGEPKFYYGCMWNLKIENNLQDLAKFTREQNMQGITPGCKDMTLECPQQPCLNGVCYDRWDGFECDCSETTFHGKRCNVPSNYASFNEKEYARITFSPPINRHTDDISLRFKTPKPNGFLFGTSHPLTPNYLKVYLENGEGVMESFLGGSRKITRFCRDLNDDNWQTLHIQRRANHLEVWTENCPRERVVLPGEGYRLQTQSIYVGAPSNESPPKDNFLGILQNFIFDGYHFFDMGISLPNSDINGNFIKESSEPLTPYNPVTFRSRVNSFITLNRLSSVDDLELEFLFKTSEPDSLLFYTEGSSGDFIAAKLNNGYLEFILDNGGGAKLKRAKNEKNLNDNEWHNAKIKRTGKESFTITVDGVTTPFSIPQSRNTFILDKNIYIGGLEPGMHEDLHYLVNSKIPSYAGCLASVRINKQRVDLGKDAVDSSQFVTSGCTSSTSFCQEDSCRNFGTCIEEINGFSCDCNMTSRIGDICTNEAEGYVFSRTEETGVVEYRFRDTIDTSMDKLAFGFKTWNPNGTLIRIDSGISADYIEVKLENGHVAVVYDLGEKAIKLIEDRYEFHNGDYHYVTFVRNGSHATLRVDDLSNRVAIPHDVTNKIFNEQAILRLGGKIQNNGTIYDSFGGILAGVYFNGIRVIDEHIYDKSKQITVVGHVDQADHPFIVEQGSLPTPDVPVSKTIDPNVPKPTPHQKIPPSNGGGMVWHEWTDDQGQVIGVEVSMYPGGGGVGSAGGVVVGGDRGVLEGIQAPLVGIVQVPPGEGTRAAAVSGAFLGVLLATSSIIWALYKFKPGFMGLGGGASAKDMNISSPRATGSYMLVKQSDASAGGAAYSSSGGTAAGYSSVARNGAAGGGASTFALKIFKSEAGTQTSGIMAASFFSEYSPVMGAASYASSGAVSGLVMGDGIVTRAIQTDLAYTGPPPFEQIARGDSFFSATDGGTVNTNQVQNSYTSDTRNTGYYREYQKDVISNTVSGYGSSGQHSASLADSGTQTLNRSDAGIQTRDSPVMQQRTMRSDEGYSMDSMHGAQHQQSYSSDNNIKSQSMQNTRNIQNNQNFQQTTYNYSDSQHFDSSVDSRSSSQQMRALSPLPVASAGDRYAIQNMQLKRASANVTNLFGAQAFSATKQRSGVMFASEEIRVDCVSLTGDGRCVVTGSNHGPPQVWDLMSGELIRIMAGEELSSTDLNLACNDTLLVGQVAEITQIDPGDKDAANRLHNRKLQIWDFETGRPVEMPSTELCTASVMMADGEKVVLGRTDKYGNGTNIVIWDLPANEPVRKLKYDAAIGFADYISYLRLSKDNRYVIAGFQNSYDNNANFIIFDLTVEDFSNVEPKVLALKAQAECTAILDNHEAITGTRKGELIIWSMRTGKPLRQIVMPPTVPHGTHSLNRSALAAATAHDREVKAVEVSNDGKLVSASADGTLKIWDLDTERLMYTLTDHMDEVWCCSISSDNDILLSGSKDHTIKLWRLQSGEKLCSFDTGIDIFSIKMSNNKRTVVALGDKDATRKLIMLQVVIHKIKSRGGSRATSPMGSDSYSYTGNMI